MSRVVIWVILSLVAGIALQARIESLSALDPAEAVVDPTLDGKGLYERLLSLGLLRLEPGGGLSLPPADLELREALAAKQAGAAYPPEGSGWAARHAALAELFEPRGKTGVAVRQAVASWNAAGGLIAIRDNRDMPAGGDRAPVLAGDRPNRWLASDTHGRPRQPSNLAVPERFGFLNDHAAPPPGMGDWAVLVGAGEETAHLTTTLTGARNGPVVIEIVGRLDRAASTLPAGVRLVQQWDQAPRCCGATLMIDATAASPLALDLVVRPVMHRFATAPGEALAPQKDQAPKWLAAAQRIGLPPEPEHGATSIATADGVTLWQANRPTAEAVALNLLPVTGIDAQDRGALGARLVARRSDVASDVKLVLTLDSRVQAAAQAALDAMVESKIAGQIDTEPHASLVVIDPDGAILAATQYPRTPAGLNHFDYAVLAAGNPERNPLLPAAWTPGTVPGSSIKMAVDLTALSAAADDPSIAAMIAGCPALADGTLPCMDFNSDPSLTQRVRPLALNDRFVHLPGQSCTAGRGAEGCGVRNFRGESFAEALKGLPRSPACAPAQHSGPRSIGMADSVRQSINTYHEMLLYRLDGAAARDYDRAARRRASYDDPSLLPDLADSKLVATLRLLGFEDRDDLLGATLAPRLGPGGHERTRLVPAASDFAALADPATKPSRAIGAVDALGQSAIGQGMSVSALQLARIAATVRNGIVPAPRLALAWNDEAVSAPAGRAFPAPDLSPLRDGMKGVVETGTAAEAFGGPDQGARDDRAQSLRAARCHIYGKTGTAELRKPEHNATGPEPEPRNSGVFAGYAETEAFQKLVPAGTEPAWTKPIAFACMVTPIRGENGRLRGQTGGSTCAFAVSDFLLRLANSSPGKV